MSLLTPEEFVTKMKNDLMNDDFDSPTCAAVRGNALFLAILHPSMEFKKRQQAFGVIGSRFAEHVPPGGRLDRVMIAMESWMSKQCKVAPSEDPDRKEGLTISVADFEKAENYVLLYEVIRTGKVIDLVLQEKVPANRMCDRSMQALMSGMLDRLRGKKPDQTGLHLHEVHLGKKPS